jgi:hypothetical protein
MERREATEQSRTEQIDTSSRLGNLMLYITFFVEKKHHRVLLLLVVVVYTQANKKASKKEKESDMFGFRVFVCNARNDATEAPLPLPPPPTTTS